LQSAVSIVPGHGFGCLTVIANVLLFPGRGHTLMVFHCAAGTVGTANLCCFCLWPWGHWKKKQQYIAALFLSGNELSVTGRSLATVAVNPI